MKLFWRCAPIRVFGDGQVLLPAIPALALDPKKIFKVMQHVDA